ncbi:ArsC/Spx/MgsR family protein, partial [Klebsiella pneumoniae]|uniref:ArsC/Spx/MgsR family protein n=2 Tax=Klebsiella pneumoniae TaxID=573 RepID=UPI00217D41AF
MSNITIYHNPACGTSRNTLEMIRNSGNEPTVIHYLENPPSRDELVKLIADMGISVRALLRKNVEPYEELGLEEDKFTGTVAKLAMRQPFVLFKGLTFQKLCLP